LKEKIQLRRETRKISQALRYGGREESGWKRGREGERGGVEGGRVRGRGWGRGRVVEWEGGRVRGRVGERERGGRES
jgi:hypothetical protein